MLSFLKNIENSEESLAGKRIENSPVIAGLISDLCDEVMVQNSSLNGIREADPALEAQFKKKVEHIGKLRGRPLYHNYIGTGSGRGPFVEIEDGSVKLDLINGIGIHVLGHSHPRVMAAAVRGSISDIIMQGNLQANNEYIKFTEKIIQLASRKSKIRHAWIATCGTMANETALKIARQKNTPARFMFAMKNAFAGRSTMMAEVTDNPAYRQGLPEYNEVLRIPTYDNKDPQSAEKALRAMKEQYAKHDKDVSCFVFEPMLGEGGFVPTPREFFLPMLDFCKANKIAVWLDEVQTFTRTGEFFAFETMDLGSYVDIVTIAKTVQVGATLYTEEYNPKPGLVSGTFAGSGASLSAGLEIINVLEGGYVGPNGRILQIYRKFIDGLNDLNQTTCKNLVQDAGGMGLMIAFTPFNGKKEKVEELIKALYKNGLICFSCGKDPVRIRFLVPAIIQDHEIDLALKVVEKTIQELA